MPPTEKTLTRTQPVPQAIDLILPAGASEKISRFVQVWLDLRKGRLVPDLSEIDPLQIPWALSSIFILKRRDDGVFVYHLTGEIMNRNLGMILRGKTADEVFAPDYATWTEKRWQRAANELRICYTHSHHRTADNAPISASRVMLPLGPLTDQDAPKANWLIGLTDFKSVGFDDYATPFDPDFRQVLWTDTRDLP